MVLILLPSYVTIGPLNLCSREDNGVEWILQDFKGWGAPGGTLTANTEDPPARCVVRAL